MLHTASFGVGIQIVHHEANFLYVRIMLINKFLDKVRPINFCPLLCDFGHTVVQLKVQKP